ncbi:hypothetical protein chiPu_0014247 [Chiloscyllium punctatum]|uniref:Uncharacterized protein n=1 Tax=Chiloscyllium punctatum TaxID=137246 RepID=A0A401SZE3_CHIPU|nr:hypothetical protein [Chiloscyllium punctatum]
MPSTVRAVLRLSTYSHVGRDRGSVISRYQQDGGESVTNLLSAMLRSLLAKAFRSTHSTWTATVQRRQHHHLLKGN